MPTYQENQNNITIIQNLLANMYSDTIYISASGVVKFKSLAVYRYIALS